MVTDAVLKIIAGKEIQKADTKSDFRKHLDDKKESSLYLYYCIIQIIFYLIII